MTIGKATIYARWDIEITYHTDSANPELNGWSAALHIPGEQLAISAGGNTPAEAVDRLMNEVYPSVFSQKQPAMTEGDIVYTIEHGKVKPGPKFTPSIADVSD